MDKSKACGAIFGVVAGMAAVFGGTAPASAAGHPPACSAISFHPVAPGVPDGTQNAGLYYSRFGRIVLHADVAGGQAKNYSLEINGKKPDPLAGPLPDKVNPCLNSKHVTTPVPSAGAACLGERFRVVVDNTAKEKYVMLFALQGDAWKLCSASGM